MRSRSHLFAVILLLLLCSGPSFGQAWSGILSTARAITWSNNVGIPGGIPSGSWANCVTTACNTAYSTPTAANITTACNSAPANSVVRIPAGSITLSSSIYCNTNNVVLRGAGPTQTLITANGNDIFMGYGSGGQGSEPGGLGTTPLSTYAQGSTVLTVGSTSGLSVGQVVEIDELNDTYVNPTGNSGDEDGGMCTSPLSFTGCDTRVMLEYVLITNVNSGAHQITIAAPGLTKTYSSSLSPQVFYWSTNNVYSYDGVENLQIDAGASTNFAISLVFCNYCWAKDVSVIHAARSGIYSFFSYRDEIRDSYVSASNTVGAPTEYGIELDHSFYTKVENNIEFGVTSPFVLETECCDVVSYNYMLTTAANDNVFPQLDTHRAHVYDVLYEGNITSDIEWDNTWGSSSHNTAFRNYSEGNQPNAINYRTPLHAAAYQRYINLTGNVWGVYGFHTVYVCDLANQQNSDDYIYDLGFVVDCVYGDTSNYDTVTESSLVRWGNWDAGTYSASGSSHKGTRWCTGNGSGSSGADAYNTACTTSETASSDPTFPGLSSPSTTLPASFYLSSQPTWFTTTWGTPQWPPIGPDVNCTTNCIASTANHAAELPAELCYNNTVQNANGFLTAFDANTCYASNAGSSAPSPPTGLTATVQ